MKFTKLLNPDSVLSNDDQQPATKEIWYQSLNDSQIVR